MSNKSNKNNTIPPSPPLEELMGSDTITAAMLNDLEQDGRALYIDPEYQANLTGSHFIASVLSAMHEKGITKATLAKKLGKHRQYMQRVLSIENEGNFTLDTIFQISFAAGLRPSLEFNALSDEANASIKAWTIPLAFQAAGGYFDFGANFDAKSFPVSGYIFSKEALVLPPEIIISEQPLEREELAA